MGCGSSGVRMWVMLVLLLLVDVHRGGGPAPSRGWARMCSCDGLWKYVSGTALRRRCGWIRLLWRSRGGMGGAAAAALSRICDRVRLWGRSRRGVGGTPASHRCARMLLRWRSCDRGVVLRLLVDVLDGVWRRRLIVGGVEVVVVVVVVTVASCRGVVVGLEVLLDLVDVVGVLRCKLWGLSWRRGPSCGRGRVGPQV